MTITIPKIEGDVDISELTTIGGDGVFDTMFGTLRKVLREEYDANRIRGTDYANALVQAFGNTLQMASTYTLSRAKLPFEVQLLEAELAKTAADIAVTTKQGALTDAQASQVLAEINRINSEVAYKLPAEVSKLISDTNNSIKEGQLIEANICKVKEDTTRIHADTVLKLPEEVKILKKQVIQASAQIDLTEAQAKLIEFDITYKSPKELAMLEQDILIKQSQAVLAEQEIHIKEQQLEVNKSEVEIKKSQLEQTAYELKYKSPAEVALTKAQADLYKQKKATEKAQVDASIADPNSVIGLNNEVLRQQAKGFTTDSQLKTASLLIDTWKVRYSTDPENADNVVDDINKLYDPNIGKTVDSLLNSVGIQ